MNKTHLFLAIACCPAGFAYGQQEAKALLPAKVAGLRSFGEGFADDLPVPEQE